MFSRLRTFLNSSIGKKVVMSLTGLALVGFLVAHLVGNLLIFADDTGDAFNTYADALRHSPLLPIAEIGLLALFIAHIGLALRTTMENRDARKERYSMRASMGKRTVGSGSMIVTGTIILVFLVVHLLDFRFAAESEDLAKLVVERLSSPVGMLIYLVGAIAVGIHLSHGVASALRSLGAHHPRFTPLAEKIGVGLAGLLFAGFALLAVGVFASPGRNAESHADAKTPTTTETQTTEEVQR